MFKSEFDQINVILIECAYHDELLKPTLILFEGISFIRNIKIFTTDNIYDRSGIQSKEISDKTNIFLYHLTDPYKKNIYNIDYIKYLLKKRSIFKRVLKEVYKNHCFKNINLIFILTISDSMISKSAIKIIKKIKSIGNNIMIIGIHNVHKWFDVTYDNLDKENLNKSKKDKYYINIFNKYIKNQRKHLIKLSDGFFTISDKLEIPSEKPKLCIPNKFMIPEILNKRKTLLNDKYFYEKCIIVIPGTVDEDRRDYFTIVKALEEFLIKNKKADIKIIFAGKLLSEGLKDRINKSLARNNILFFNRYLSAEEYKEYLLNSHFVLLNLRNVPPYGKYKISGPENDARSMGIPLLVPDRYEKKQEDINVIRYDKLINSIDIAYNYYQDRKKYINIALKAIENANKYEINVIRAKVIDTITKMIKNKN
jgi:hypothetical protein